MPSPSKGGKSKGGAATAQNSDAPVQPQQRVLQTRSQKAGLQVGAPLSNRLVLSPIAVFLWSLIRTARRLIPCLVPCRTYTSLSEAAHAT